MNWQPAANMILSIIHFEALKCVWPSEDLQINEKTKPLFELGRLTEKNIMIFKL